MVLSISLLKTAIPAHRCWWRSPDVDVISYRQHEKSVGSSPTGANTQANESRTRWQNADDRVRRCDLDAVAPLLVKALTMFSGQFCMTGSRVLAHRKIADDLRERLRTMIENVMIGPSDDPTSQLGPLIDKANVERVNHSY
jgi:hypothetical protein